jgi:hypothetical protein
MQRGRPSAGAEAVVQHVEKHASERGDDGSRSEAQPQNGWCWARASWAHESGKRKRRGRHARAPGTKRMNVGLRNAWSNW